MKSMVAMMAAVRGRFFSKETTEQLSLRKSEEDEEIESKEERRRLEED